MGSCFKNSPFDVLFLDTTIKNTIMGKSIYFSGQPIFTQLLNLIPKRLIYKQQVRHQTNRYYKKFMFYDHLVAMLYASFHKSSSLRELITGLQANSSRLFHLGIKHTPRRSTLAEANTKRPVQAFADLYHALYRYYFGLPDSRLANNRLFILDSTTITLFSSIMQGAGSYKANGRKKGGVKAHTMLDADNNVPAFVYISEAKENDLVFYQKVTLPRGSTVVMDKAYIKYEQFKKWTEQGVRWVTRLRNDACVELLEQYPIAPSTLAQGVLADKKIRLGRPSNARITPLIDVRLVVYYDAEKDRSFDFISNDFECSALEIAAIYKKRWDIELLFKRIKQAQPLKYFLGDTSNAIQIQIWAAFICDLLIKIVQHHVNKNKLRRWSYANLAAMVKHHLMTYINLIPFLINPEKALLNYHPPDQQQLGLKFI